MFSDHFILKSFSQNVFHYNTIFSPGWNVDTVLLSTYCLAKLSLWRFDRGISHTSGKPQPSCLVEMSKMRGVGCICLQLISIELEEMWPASSTNIVQKGYLLYQDPIYIQWIAGPLFTHHIHSSYTIFISLDWRLSNKSNNVVDICKYTRKTSYKIFKNTFEIFHFNLHF